VGGGSAVAGQDLPSATASCDGAFTPASASYGLPVDVNLDGIVDGEDLAFLASLFGVKLP
jgi:hypothetical protein